jgi:MFS transporter, SP family, inositol transporter
LALALAQLGLLGIRLIFGHLFIVAAVTWRLRRGIIESPRYEEMAEQSRSGDEADDDPGLASRVVDKVAGTEGEAPPVRESRWRELFGPAHRKALLFIFTVFCLWNIPAGTHGFFLPFILKNSGETSQAASVAIQALWFVTAILAVAFIFMPINDRVTRAALYGITALIQAAAFLVVRVRLADHDRMGHRERHAVRPRAGRGAVAAQPRLVG